MALDSYSNMANGTLTVDALQQALEELRKMTDPMGHPICISEELRIEIPHNFRAEVDYHFKIIRRKSKRRRWRDS